MAKQETKQEAKELVKTEPSRILAPFDAMERWFEEAFRRPSSLLSPSWLPKFREAITEEVMPSVDIFEEGDNVVVKAELPGIRKEDIDVSMTNNTVSISGEKKKEEKVERKNYSTRAKIIGPVDSATNGLVVLGVTVDVSNAGVIPTLSAGQIARVVGTYSNDVLFASQISLSDTTLDGESNDSWDNH